MLISMRHTYFCYADIDETSLVKQLLELLGDFSRPLFAALTTFPHTEECNSALVALMGKLFLLGYWEVGQVLDVS